MNNRACVAILRVQLRLVVKHYVLAIGVAFGLGWLANTLGGMDPASPSNNYWVVCLAGLLLFGILEFLFRRLIGPKQVVATSEPVNLLPIPLRTLFLTKLVLILLLLAGIILVFFSTFLLQHTRLSGDGVSEFLGLISMSQLFLSKVALLLPILILVESWNQNSKGDRGWRYSVALLCGLFFLVPIGNLGLLLLAQYAVPPSRTVLWLCSAAVASSALCLLCISYRSIAKGVSQFLGAAVVFGFVQAVLMLSSFVTWSGHASAFSMPPVSATFLHGFSWLAALWAVAVGVGTAFLSRGQHQRWSRYAWIAFCMLTGTAGLVTYLIVRKHVTRESCPACGFRRRLSLVPCPQCGFPGADQ